MTHDSGNAGATEPSVTCNSHSVTVDTLLVATLLLFLRVYTCVLHCGFSSATAPTPSFPSTTSFPRCPNRTFLMMNQPATPARAKPTTKQDVSVAMRVVLSPDESSLVVSVGTAALDNSPPLQDDISCMPCTTVNGHTHRTQLSFRAGMRGQRRGAVL